MAVAVVGSANVDLVVGASRLPRPGETVLGGEFREFLGGKGANQAVATFRAGGGTVRVSFVAKVGDDERGSRVERSLRDEGLDVSALKRETGVPTGVALIVVDPAGENLITVAPGANARLAPADVEAARGLIRGADAVLAQLEVPFETVEAAFRQARDAGVRTILNPAPAPPGGVPREILARTGVLVANRLEGGGLAGMEVRSAEEALEACAALRDGGPEAVVITLGAEGAVFAASGETGRVPAFSVEAVDATGAGDAFCGGLTAALAEGKDWPEAVRFAAAAGALSCTVRGAQPSMPRRETVEALLAGDE